MGDKREIGRKTKGEKMRGRNRKKEGVTKKKR